VQVREGEETADDPSAGPRLVLPQLIGEQTNLTKILHQRSVADPDPVTSFRLIIFEK
jgi:hypothetical protein